MKKTLFFPLALLLLLVTASCTPDAPPAPAPGGDTPDFSTHPKHAFYRAELENHRRAQGAPGGLMLVKTPADGLWIGASGKSNLEHQTDMRGNERFRVGSITKTFTATVVLKLQEEGKLSLDDKLAGWLPATQGQIPQADQITLRHLLTHTSGIRNLGDDNVPFQLALLNRPADVDMAWPEPVLKRYVYGKPLDFPPGTGYFYSNTGFTLLGMIAEKAGGRSLKRQMQELIFAPLGMQDTYLEKRDDPGVVRGYYDLYGNGKLLDVSDWEKAYDDGSAAGGLITTATDLLRFSEALFGGRLLKAQSMAEMVTSTRLPSCPEGDCEYGYGLETWQFKVGRSQGHVGGVIGIDAIWFYFPQKHSTVIIFTNKGLASDKSILERLLS
jgi:D-alanyl-D-alanine carboxypeptidase